MNLDLDFLVFLKIIEMHWSTIHCKNKSFLARKFKYIDYLHIGIASTQVKVINPKSEMVKINLIIDVACQNNLVRLAVTFGS